MILDLVVNWRMKLFVTFLFLAAVQSCNLENSNLYAAFWLEERSLQGTSRQIVKKEVRLPDWYLRLYFILSVLRSLVKMEKATIISRLSSILILGGPFCISLGILLKSQQVKEERVEEIQNCIWVASLKVNSSIIRVAVSVSTQSILKSNPMSSAISCEAPVAVGISAEAIEKPVQEFATGMSAESTKQICAPSENVPIIVKTEQADNQKIHENLAISEPKLIPKAAHIAKINAKKVEQNKNAIGYPPAIEKQMKKFYRTLSEKDKRRYAGVEAIKFGRGGIMYIARVLECDRKDGE